MSNVQARLRFPWQWKVFPRAPAYRKRSLTADERRILLIAVDLLLLNLSLLAAVALWGRSPITSSAVWANIKWYATLSALWIGFGLTLDIYNLARSGHASSSLLSVSFAIMLSALVYVLTPWLTPPLLHRSYAFGLLFFMMSSLLSWRVFYAKALCQPAFYCPVLLVGSEEISPALIEDLLSASQADNTTPFRGTGYQVVGLVTSGCTPVQDNNRTPPIVGNIQHLVSLAHQMHVSEIVVALDERRKYPPEVYEALLDCREAGLVVSSFAAFYERLTARVPVEYIHCDPHVLLSPPDIPSIRLYQAVKRLLDCVLALVCLVPMVLLIPWIALANALWSPGPLFYRQERLGRGGTPFALLKFRSMIVNAEQTSGAIWSSERDPRITPIGRWLRRTRLDELPQLINVLRGEMSLVGPRPERPCFVGQLARDIPLYLARHAVRPGITGWAQIRYRYGNSVEDSRIKLEYDLYYIKHASLSLDFLILLQTLPIMIQLKGK